MTEWADTEESDISVLGELDHPPLEGILGENVLIQKFHSRHRTWRGPPNLAPLFEKWRKPSSYCGEHRWIL